MRVAFAVVGGGLLTLACAGGGVWAENRAATPSPPPLPASGPPVIVELFSSEGCSSCPPADAWLLALDRAQSLGGAPVIALEEHVDYWDRLGWRDPFGQAQFGERQQAYARVLPDRRVYTPEIVIDGHAVVDNGDEEQAARDARASASQPRATVKLVRNQDHVTIDVTGVPNASDDDGAEVWLAVTERRITSNVSQGENAGRRLAHGPIVRELRRVGLARAGAFHGDAAIGTKAGWVPGALRVVVFVQRAGSKRIVGANAI
jgi:hypothetical protein